MSTVYPFMGRNTKQCPYCRGWIALPIRNAHRVFEAHKLECRAKTPDAVQVPGDWACAHCGESVDVLKVHHCPPATETVKRATLWDGVVDTFASEAELNGFRPSQGALL